MIPSDIGSALLLLVAGAIALLVALWVYYDRRDRRFYEGTRRQTTFHCLKCGHVYTSVEQHELCPCPRCGQSNPRLHF